MKMAAQKSYRRPEHGEGHPDYDDGDVGADDAVDADDDVGVGVGDV